MMNRIQNSRGFTLLEMAIVLLIVGVLAGLFFKIIPPFIQTMRYLATESRQNNVEEALALYVAQNFRVPCPADPSVPLGNANFGYEDGSGPNGDVAPVAAGCPRTEGILPYKTIGVGRLDAMDGWNRYMTYAISADFGKPVWGNAALNSVHELCRSKEWMADVSGLNARNNADEDQALFGAFDAPGSVAGTTPFNKNPWKAKFCCMAPAGGADLQIVDQNGLDVMVPQAAWTLDNAATSWNYAANTSSYRAAGLDGYANTTTMSLRGTRHDPYSLDNPKYRIDDPFPDTSYINEGIATPSNAAAMTTGHDTDATDYRGNAAPAAGPMQPFSGWNVSPVYILISHGENGFGAYRVDGTMTRGAAAPGGSPDAENSDGDQVFNYRYIKSDAPATLFDDIFTWGTQETLLSLTGQSCITP